MVWTTRKQTGSRLSSIISVEEFFRYVKTFYLSIGMVAYDLRQRSSSSRWRRILLNAYFILQMLNLNAVLLSELIYVFRAFITGNNFLEATMNLSFIGFVVLGDIKIRLIWHQRDHISQVVAQLDELHPHEVEQQAQYGVFEYLRSYKRVSTFYFGVHLVLIWSYNLYWAVYYVIYDYWLGIRLFERTLPYYCWTPWDWQTNWSYYLMYISQNLAGQACLSGQLAADMFMCALVTLLIMHLRRLATMLGQHVAGLLPPEKDLAFLRENIVYHQRLLLLVEDVNQIFGISLLCNLASSACIICFVIFQITIGGNIDNLIMLGFFLFCALVQVFMIGSYAQRLIDAVRSLERLKGKSILKYFSCRASKWVKLFIATIGSEEVCAIKSCCC